MPNEEPIPLPAGELPQETPQEDPQKEEEEAATAAPPEEPPAQEAAKEEEKVSPFWDCTVPKVEGGKWGFSFELGRSYLQIQTVGDVGSFVSYNSTALEADQLVPELCITKVNDIVESSGMSAEFKKTELNEVKLRVCMPKTMAVSLGREGIEPWGVELLFYGEELGVLVKSIKPDGIFDKYNLNADTPEESKLLPGDIIVRFNSLCKGTDMVENLKNPSTKSLEMKLLRLPKDEA